MKPRDWFAVGVRLFGIWMLLQCLDDLRAIVDILAGLFTPVRTPIAAYAVHAIINAVVGMYLLSGAPGITSLAFPRRKSGLCESCGYDLAGNTSGTCPECGAKIAEPSAQK